MDFQRFLEKASAHPAVRKVSEVVGFWEILAIVIVIVVAYKRFTRDPRLAHLPPHVRGWPIINQALDHVKDNPIPNVIRWAQTHGELFTTTSGTTRFIWINSRKAFKELIDRRSGIYSSKHPQPMVMRASGQRRMVFMPYGKDWRAIRNIIHRVISSGTNLTNSCLPPRCQGVTLPFRPLKPNNSLWIYLILHRTFICITAVTRQVSL